MDDPFNCPKCGAHDWGLFRAACLGCPHCATNRIQELEGALRKIGAYETDAREMVAKGFHNTTLAIDLAGMANAALASQSDAGAKPR